MCTNDGPIDRWFTPEHLSTSRKILECPIDDHLSKPITYTNAQISEANFSAFIKSSVLYVAPQGL